MITNAIPLAAPPAAKSASNSTGESTDAAVEVNETDSGDGNKGQLPQKVQKAKSAQTKDSQATSIVRLVLLHAKLFHCPAGRPFASVQIDKFREVYCLEDTDFQNLIATYVFKICGKAVSDRAL